jgi:CBS domain containing-hemolysin-like protein
MSSYLIDALLLPSLFIFIAANAFFVASEFALVTVRWTRVEELVSRGRFGAKAVQQAVENLDDAIAATQLGITFASLALGWVGEPALAHLIEPLFRGLPTVWGVVLSHTVAVALAFLLLTYLHVVLGELAPKAIALQRAEDVALLVTGPLLVFARVFRPFINFMNGSGNWIVRMLRLPPRRPDQDVHSVDELGMLVEETAEAGIIPSDQAEYVRNVFRLSGKRTRDVMVPRDKVVTLSFHASPDEILAVCRETAHTRMPIWEGDPDNIVGIVNTKNLFHLFSQTRLVLIVDAMYPPIFADPDLSVGRLLAIFRRERRPMAVVRDSAGKFHGIVTLEDILEEIVGEIEDEHDVPAPPESTRPAAATRLGSALATGPVAVPGRTALPTPERPPGPAGPTPPSSAPGPPDSAPPAGKPEPPTPDPGK